MATDDPAAAADPERALLLRAAELVVRDQLASATFLQRRLRIGWARASALLDELEENGVVGPPQVGAPSRRVLATPDQLDQVLGSLAPAPPEGEP